MKLSKQLSGIAGEYYVAAELSRRGYLAAITLRNSDGVDILASNSNGERTFSIQVKTTQNKRKWILTKKVENDKTGNKFYVFVNIPNELNSLPEYYIVRAKDLAINIFEGHRNWMKEPGRNGRIRRDSNIRQFDPRYFSENKLLNWENLISIFEE
jgi:uncharacterized membrane protein